MKTLDMTGTKWEIFRIAVELFSKKSYKAVTLRDIANITGIKASSIYNHFASKDDILVECYRFYNTNFQTLLPDLNGILDLIGKMDPHEILKKCIFFFEERLLDMMKKCLLIIQTESASDKRAKEIIVNTFVGSYRKYYSAILNKMIEMKEIEPLNVDAFIGVISSYDYAAAVRSAINFEMTDEGWLGDRELLLTLIKVKEKVPS